MPDIELLRVVRQFKGYRLLANYPQDLNATHEMECWLDDEQYQWFTRSLYYVVTGKRMKIDLLITPCVMLMVRASARQRCEAFVLAMGKNGR